MGNTLRINITSASSSDLEFYTTTGSSFIDSTEGYGYVTHASTSTLPYSFSLQSSYDGDDPDNVRYKNSTGGNQIRIYTQSSGGSYLLSDTLSNNDETSDLNPDEPAIIKFYDTTTYVETSIMEVAAVCFPPFTLIETPNGLTQIGYLKVGDEVKTHRGIVKISKNMITNTPLGATFVFFPKDCICEGFPSEDAYITEFHPIAIKNVEEDNKDVMHFIEARHFINKFKGIELKKIDTKTYHNLVFDTVEIFNVGGIKVFSHHPNNTPIKLRKDEFLGEVNEREPVNLYYTFEQLLEDKKEEEDLGEFIKNIFIYN